MSIRLVSAILTLLLLPALLLPALLPVVQPSGPLADTTDQLKAMMMDCCAEETGSSMEMPGCGSQSDKRQHCESADCDRWHSCCSAPIAALPAALLALAIPVALQPSTFEPRYQSIPLPLADPPPRPV